MKNKKVLALFCLLLVSCNTLFAVVRSYRRTAHSVNFVLDRGLLQIVVLRDDMMRVKYTSLDVFPDKQSLVVLPGVAGTANFTLTENGKYIIITTAKIKVMVDRLTNALTYTDLSGTVILAEDQAAGKTMQPDTIVGVDTYRCDTRFSSPKDEALFGLGCHPLDSLSINYKGRDQDMAIKYLTGAIPVLLSSRGYGLLWDNYSESRFYGAQEENTKFTYSSESGGMIDYYFFYGPDFDRIIDSYRRLTGTAPMYPRWSFGLFQSQDRYKTQAEVLSVKDNYRNNHIPVDAIVQDWYYWYPLPIGVHQLNPASYPDPAAMVSALHKAHLHAMISIWPCFGTGTADFNALQKAGYLTSITWDNFTTHTRDTYYDAFHPGAREMYWRQARDSLIRRQGWDAWWVDQCEPDTEDPNDRKKARFFTGKGLDYFNTYSLMHTGGIYTKWRRDIPGKRIFLLARQAFAGQQRNAATLWSSDITTTFASFRNQVPQAINACVSGIPYWTSDIGGYLSRVSPEGVPDWSEPGYRELFVRWFQFGVFCPITRIHGKGERALFSKNWDEPTRDILLNYDRLRYRLLPYVYSLAGKVTQENYTPMRSLAFDFRNDTAVYNIPDQYMFGPAILVNPVTRPLFTGPGSGGREKNRNVYLPKGAAWIDFWTGRTEAGGQVVTAPAPMDIMPLYVRAGSIIPMGPVLEYATEKQADTLELRIYPGANGRFTLYEDENDNYHYEKNGFATITFTWLDDLHELKISDRHGSFPGMLKHRIFNIVLVRENAGVGVSPATRIDQRVEYNGQAMRIHPGGRYSGPTAPVGQTVQVRQALQAGYVGHSGRYDITAYGAVANSGKICTRQLQAAIDACNRDGGGDVEIPPGIFLTGTVHLKSHVNLYLQSGAILRGSANLDDYEWSLAEPGFNRVRKGMLFTEDADDVSIAGQGQIDGNGDVFFETGIAKRLDSVTTLYTRQQNGFRHVDAGLGDGPIQPKERPYQMIVFSSCNRVTVKDIFITKSPFWCMHFADCDAVHVNGIRLWNNMLAPNADGIDVTSCSNVIIDGCDIRSGDDALAIVGYDHHFEIPGFRHLKHACGNIVISNCNLQSNSSGIRIGYLDQNTLENVRVSNVNITHSSRGIGIFLRDEGSIRNVTFTNMYIETRMPTGDWWGNGEPIHISAIRGKEGVTLGKIENIQFDNIICRGDAGMVVYGTDESTIRDLSFKNIRFELVDSKLNDVAGGNIDLRGALGNKSTLFARDIPGFLAEHVDGLIIDDFKLTWTEPRMPFLTNGIEVNDFKDVRITHFQGTGAPNNPGTYPIRGENGSGFQTDLPGGQVHLNHVK